MQSALSASGQPSRTSHNSCYVLRPRACGLVALRLVVASVLPLSPAGGGQQNGAGDAPPLRLLLRGRCARWLFVVLCGKPRHCLMRGKLRYPHTPRSCAVARTAPPRLFDCPAHPGRSAGAGSCRFASLLARPVCPPPVRPGGAPIHRVGGGVEAPAVCYRA
jgi:hypothetical protein